LLLRAATRRDAAGREAFAAWRRAVRLDDIDDVAHRAMPLILEHGAQGIDDDPDLARMRGMVRRIWTANVLNLQQLFAALDAIEAAGLPPLLLKAAAVFARAPELAARRIAGDYDVLVPAGDAAVAARALAHAGFVPQGFAWGDFASELVSSVAAGAALARPGQHGSIDLHWRPLPDIHDGALAARVFAAAEPMRLRGRAVRVPSLTHHLFLALARCEPWDPGECFHRLIEGHLLVSRFAGGIDWAGLDELVATYGLEAAAAAFLGTLAAEALSPVPAALLERLEARLSPARRRDWRLRAVPPARRSMLAQWYLGREDARASRASPLNRPVGLAEALLRQASGGALPALPLLWRLACARHHGPANGRLRFLEGFSYPEASGRWSDGRFAVLAAPLGDAQRRGEPLRIRMHPYLAGRRRVRVRASAGGPGVSLVFSRNDRVADIALRARPQERLGGDALVLLCLPDALSPAEAGESPDRRRLGVHILRDWQG
jgi:hypothetical protein